MSDIRPASLERAPRRHELAEEATALSEGPGTRSRLHQSDGPQRVIFNKKLSGEHDLGASVLGWAGERTAWAPVTAAPW